MVNNNGALKFAYGKFGLKVDPRGAHVTLAWQGRVLLGEVTGCIRDEVLGCVRLVVRHFDGSAWPVQPSVLAVDVLARR